VPGEVGGGRHVALGLGVPETILAPDLEPAGLALLNAAVQDGQEREGRGDARGGLVVRLRGRVAPLPGDADEPRCFGCNDGLVTGVDGAAELAELGVGMLVAMAADDGAKSTNVP